MKISIVTVVYNAQDTIAQCINSVISQKYPDIEYIIVDGGSTDNTLQIIDQYASFINVLVSEPDQGIYDAMNKGIKIATGQVVGTLNADDQLAGDMVLSAVAEAFINQGADAVYGNLHIVNQAGKIIRKWHSKQCGKNSFNRGFMPPHPTFYCKRELFSKLGFYSLAYGSAADYELMVRFMYLHHIKNFYLNVVMVTMRHGGVSNSSFKNRIRAWGFDLKAMRKNNIKFPLLALFLKPLRKAYQYI
ncbi:glycosyltransferase family 2 protein [Mucilaginibacter sp. FT3.2]|uniref:glycosyltransferase family 2 protein n=1 Tax=Mucilaginibacter sp. FT3.2 TaxID=2723090 RepID=UPI00161EBE45|nr:glycosyltransferase family 2 protein [Mucilaginibacter sp. FT3.2]MBB6231287.1 glycosyltransferase involved in cell wall biosynthesis [Mucilaginibacter sp. FT3.2]